MFGPSVRGNAPTMTSAEFWLPIPTPREVCSTVAGNQTSQGKARDLHTYTCRIYFRSSRASTGLWRYAPPYPLRPPHAVPVRQVSALPTASFRFHLAVDTLADRLVVPLAGPTGDLHPQVIRPAPPEPEQRPPRRYAPCLAHAQKRQTSQPAFLRRELALLDSDDVLSLGAFLTLSHGELNLLAFGQRLEA